MEHHGGHDVIAIGASAGGVEALRRLCAQMPAELAAAVLVVQHTGAGSSGMLSDVLGRAGPLPAEMAADGRRLEAGRIYIAPHDFHLLVKNGHLLLRRGPRENRTRPAVDPLFRSVAVAFGSRAVGVILTGFLDDGTAGLQAIVSCGGKAIVQHPETAFARQMPESALRFVVVDHILPLGEIAAELVRLTRSAPGPTHPPSERLLMEVRMAELDGGPISDRGPAGEPSDFTCPECGGPLRHLEEERLHRYRCLTGHAYTESALRQAQTEELERALYGALRALREKQRLAEQRAARAADSGRAAPGRGQEEAMRQTLKDMGAIEEALLRLMPSWEMAEPPERTGTDR